MPYRDIFALAIRFTFVTLVSISTVYSAQPNIPHLAQTPPDLPDLTRGGKIDNKHDWNLGPTGARGWMWGWALRSDAARQIYITAVDANSPADGKLRVGDVILGINGGLFNSDARIAFGNAITEAEKNSNGGQLRLTRWRNGSTSTVTLQLQVMGTYSSLSPVNCPKTEKIIQGAKQYFSSNGIGNGDITKYVNALALLAVDDGQFTTTIRNFARGLNTSSAKNSMSSWRAGYMNLFLCEYYLATNDSQVLSKIRDLSLFLANGQGEAGVWGHGNIGIMGRLEGYGAITSSSLVSAISLILSQKCGVNDAVVSTAINRSNNFFSTFVGKGGIPYGDHHPMNVHDSNGRNSTAVVFFDLLKNQASYRYFAKMTVASYGEREEGHTGNYWSFLWGPLGAMRAGEQAAAAFLKEQRWFYDLERRWNGSFTYQGGAGQEGSEHTTPGWDTTGARLLTYAMNNKRLYITGKGLTSTNAITGTELQQTLLAGENHNSWVRFGQVSRDSYADLSSAELLSRLNTWSAPMRKRVAVELAKRSEDHLNTYRNMLKSGNRDQILGALAAMRELGNRSEPAILDVYPFLSHSDHWVRYHAFAVMSKIGHGAKRIALPKILELATKTYGDDPRETHQTYTAQALWGPGWGENLPGMILWSMNNEDPAQVIPAVRKILTNENGLTRKYLADAWEKMNFDKLHPYWNDIVWGIENPAPSGIMFNSVIREKGLQILSKHRFRETVPVALKFVQSIKPHASEHRIKLIFDELRTFGAEAKSILPGLRNARSYYEQNMGEGRPIEFPDHVKAVFLAHFDDGIRDIENATQTPSGLRNISDYIQNYNLTPPNPNPMTWAKAATVTSTSATLTANTASDPKGVEYYFMELSGNAGGNDSGWISSRSYTDSGLVSGQTYVYTVRARDKDTLQNKTGVSTTLSVTIPSNKPPVISIAPSASPNSIKISESTNLSLHATDPDGNALSYTWTKVSGPGSVNFASQDSFTPATFSLAGNYVLRVSVSDGQAQVSATVSVSVKDVPAKSQLGLLDLAANNGLNPATGQAWKVGDTYRLAFVTSAKRKADSSNIATYDAFIQGLANAQNLGGNWKVIGSTQSIDAKDHTQTNPSKHGKNTSILMIDGKTIIADNYERLWQGGLRSAIHRDEKGNSNINETVLTGTNGNGTKNNRWLGGSTEANPRVTVGRSNDAGRWMVVYHAGTNDALRFYAISNVLSIQEDTESSNRAPVAQNQNISTDENKEVSFTLSASDPDDNPLSYTITKQPSQGQLSGSAPNLTYKPNLAFYGNDSISFKVNDGSVDSNIATVNITVKDVNHPPWSLSGIQADPSTIQVGQNTNLSIGASDFDGDPITASWSKVSGPGSVTFGSASAQTTASMNTPGTYKIKVTLSDGKASSEYTRNITVTEAPQDLNLKGELGILDLSANNGNNPATNQAWKLGDTYHLTFVTSAKRDASSHDINTYNTFVQNLADQAELGGKWKVIGATGSVDARTNTLSDPSKNGQNTAILLIDGSTIVANHYGDLWDGSIDNPINQNELGNKNIDVSVFLGVNSNGTMNTRHLGGSDESSPRVAIGNSKDHGSRWSLVYHGGTKDLKHFYAISTALKIVSDDTPPPVANKKPQAQNQNKSVDQGQSVSIQLSASDADQDPLTYQIVSGPSHGTLSGTAPNLNYTANGNYEGQDSFTFKANDGKDDSNIATVNISVNKVIVVSNAGLYFGELNGNINTSDANPKTLILTDLSIKTEDGIKDNTTEVYTGQIYDADGNISFTENIDDKTRITINGVQVLASDSWRDRASTQNLKLTPGWNEIEIRISNGGGGSGRVSSPGIGFDPNGGTNWQVLKDNGNANLLRTSGDTTNPPPPEPNKIPVASSQSISLDQDKSFQVTLNATDGDSDQLNYRIISNPSHGSLSGTAPNLTYNPKAGFHGNDSFTFKANDGKDDSNLATVSITVKEIKTNDNLAGLWFGELNGNINTTDPNPKTQVLTDVSSKTEDRINGNTTEVFTGQIYDADGNISFTEMIDDKTRIYIDGDLVLSDDTWNRRKSTSNLKLTPGWHEIEIRISNGSGGSGKVQYPGIGYDPNGGTNWQLLKDTGDASFLRISGDISTPPPELEPNQAPVAQNQSVNTSENQSVDITLVASDADGDTLSYTVVFLPKNGSISGSGKNITYTPKANYSGSDTFHFGVNDGQDNSNLATVTINIQAIVQSNATRITGTDGNADSWNVGYNWSDGIPTGSKDASIAAGKTIHVDNNSTPSYTGKLTLESNSSLRLNSRSNHNSQNAIKEVSHIEMQSNSTLVINLNTDVNVPPITLKGSATVDAPAANSDWQTTSFKAILGTHPLQLKGYNGHKFILTEENSFGELISVAHDRHYIHAQAKGALGLGNVTINGRGDGRSAQLVLEAQDTISDQAILTLNGKGFNNNTSDCITVAAGINEVVSRLIIQGKEIAQGTYDNREPWLIGDGQITVLQSSSAQPSLVTSSAPPMTQNISEAGGSQILDSMVTNYSGTSLTGQLVSFTLSVEEGQTKTFSSGSLDQGTYVITSDIQSKDQTLTLNDPSFGLQGTSLGGTIVMSSLPLASDSNVPDGAVGKIMSFDSAEQGGTFSVPHTQVGLAGSYKLYRQGDDGIFVDTGKYVSIDGDYVSFTLDSFSVYVLVDDQQVAEQAAINEALRSEDPTEAITGSGGGGGGGCLLKRQ